MQYRQVVAKRRMVRSFDRRSIDSAVVDALLRDALGAPSAGNTAALEFLVLVGPEQTGSYWDLTLSGERRDDFRWPGLLDAPVLIVPWVDPSAYVRRYQEPDKSHTGLGTRLEDWPVPYWFVDGGAAVMTVLHGAVDAGLGALFFGLFDHEEAVRAAFAVPVGRRAVGAVALGYPRESRESSSAGRPKPEFGDVVHRGIW